MSTSATSSDRSAPSTSPQLIRFLNDPKDFSGVASSKVSPLNWLKKLNRIKDLAALSDREILLIAADHLTGRAEAWFDVACANVTTWSAFCVLFKKKYCSGLESLWRTEIKNLKQMEGESIEDVAVKLRELYSLINNDDEASMVHTFLDAIDPSVAREVEAKLSLDTADLDKMVTAASQLESVNLKYSKRHVNPKPAVSVTESQYHFPAASLNEETVSRSGHSESSSHTIADLLKEFRELKISLVNSHRPTYQTNQYRPNSNIPRSFTCFHCGEEGHKKTECPKFSQPRPPPNVLTGSNAIPISDSGKDSNRRL